MSVLSYPGIQSYKLPEKNVLVISCIDLRLTDNLLQFLHYDNLANRYDHFVLAGTSLCCFADDKHRHLFDPDKLKAFDYFKSWKTALEHHLEIAVALHDIRDVYIVEHANCGAYKEFLKDGSGKYNTAAAERKAHKFFGKALADALKGKVRTYKKQDDNTEQYRIHAHCFMIDLRGNVDLLYSTNIPGKKKG